MLLTLNDLILNYWQIKRRFENRNSYFSIGNIHLMLQKKKKKFISQKRKDLISWKLNSNICRLSGILECNFCGLQNEGDASWLCLDGICFPLASSILLKCSKLYTCTWQIFKFLGSSKKKYCRKLFFPCSFYYIEVITIL